MEEVYGNSHTNTQTFTRPADTTPYAAGDVICNSTSAPVIITFTGFRDQRRGSIIQDLVLVSSANQSTKLEADLLLFDTAVTMDNDNAAFTPSDAEMATCVARIPIYTTDWAAGDATSGAGGNAVAHVRNLGIPVNMLGSQELFGVLVARNAYTPVSAEVFTFRLKVLD